MKPNSPLNPDYEPPKPVKAIAGCYMIGCLGPVILLILFVLGAVIFGGR